MRGVSECPRGKDRYIGRLYSDVGKVPSDPGIFRSTGELREYREKVMGLIGPCGKERGQPWAACASPPLGPKWTRGGGPHPLSYSLSPSSFPPCRRSPTRGGSPTPSRTPPSPWCASSRGRPPPSFIYRGGAPSSIQ